MININRVMNISSNLHIKNFVLSSLILALMLGVGSCSNDTVEIPDSNALSGDTFTITGSLIIPEMPELLTRGNMGNEPKNGLKLTILEFDLASTPEQSFITNVYRAEIKTINGNNTGVENGGLVTYNVTINAATTPKVLHLMIADDYIAVPSSGGSIATLLPSLAVGNNSQNQPEAYWGYAEFPDGFSTTRVENDITIPVLRQDVKEKLTNLPVIRNFAQITVTKSSSLLNFEIIGFDLVNCPTSGTIAPYNTDLQEIPSLLTKNDEGETIMKSYGDITNPQKEDTTNPEEEDTTNPEEDTTDPTESLYPPGLPYSGILPANVGFRNQEEAAKSWVDGVNSNMRSTAAKFIYEHPYEPTRRTYVIINANYRAPDSSNWEQGFYKIDIGKLNDDGSFNYYNIIRNINYNIQITEALAPGTKTVAEAISRAPFNNLLAAIETSSSLNVSDGTNMLIVNDVNHVVVNNGGEVKILYRYLTDVTGVNNVDNEKPNYIVGEGKVIKKNAAGEYDITKQAYTDETTGARWYELTVKTNDPDMYETLEQTITIVDKKGLGRTITIVLRKPWEYQKIGTNTATVARGSSNLYGSNVPTTPENISNAAGAEFTLYFNLPDGIPDSVFPLEFTIEAKYQGIENNKIGTLLVTSGSSLFDPNVTAIQYIKTVTLNEYKYQYNGEHDSSGFDVSKFNTNHTIRCRFLTISAVANNSDAKIRIYNQYFVNPIAQTESASDPYLTKCAEVTFKRMTNP